MRAPQPQYGGAAVGIGYGLVEEFDYKHAIPNQLNFDRHLIATAMDVPHINAIIVENADAGPFGAKSIAEPATEIAGPGIANAVCNATGKPVSEIPATLERVLIGHKVCRQGAHGSEQKDLLAGDACKLGVAEL